MNQLSRLALALLIAALSLSAAKAQEAEPAPEPPQKPAAPDDAPAFDADDAPAHGQASPSDDAPAADQAPPPDEPASDAPVAAEGDPDAEAAEPPELSLSEPEAQALLDRLASDDWKERRAAEKELVAMGDEGESLIRALLKKATDVEARTRLESALQQIADGRRDGTTFITMHLKDVTAREVLAELTRQARAPIRTYPENLFEHGKWPKVNIDLDRVPFWEAVRQISAATGLSLNPWNDGLRLMRGGGGGGQIDGPSVTEGPFLIVANSVSRNQSINLGLGQNAQDEFGVRLSALVEPKITVLHCSSVVDVEEAVDDKGNDLAFDARAPGGTYYGGSGAVWTLYARLRYPEKNPGTKITRLRGTVTFNVQAGSQMIEIADLLTAPEAGHVVGGINVQFKGMKKSKPDDPASTYELTLSITQDALAGNSWNQIQRSMQSKLKVLDADGNPLDSRGFGSSGNNNRIDFNLQFARSQDPQTGQLRGEPAKLVWEVPTETKDRKVSFEFTDLPMP